MVNHMPMLIICNGPISNQYIGGAKMHNIAAGDWRKFKISSKTSGYLKEAAVFSVSVSMCMQFAAALKARVTRNHNV